MRNPTDILTGLLAMATGALLVLWITPAQTVPSVFASVPSGFYPNFTSGMLVMSGLALGVSGILARSPERKGREPNLIAVKFGAALVLVVPMMLAVPFIGFVPAGVLICLITLVAMRETRWQLIVSISVAAPLLVWGGFEVLLGRPLP